MRLGAHVSVAGSLDRAIDRGREIGCECIQIFVGNPRQWRRVRYSAGEKAEFRRKCSAAAFDPVVAHSRYLVNLASPRREARLRSVRSLIEAMKTVEELGGTAVVTHIGSRLGAPVEEALARVADSIRRVLEATAGADLLLENSAGATLGAGFDELAEILEHLGGHSRVGFCLDTAHLFGAGFDIRRPRGVAAMLDEFEARVGLERLRLLHLNDSSAELGSRRDRHANIGEGTIGRSGFRALLREPRVRRIAGILETPGFDGRGPDRENLKRLRSLAGLRRGTRRRASGAG